MQGSLNFEPNLNLWKLAMAKGEWPLTVLFGTLVTTSMNSRSVPSILIFLGQDISPYSFIYSVLRMKNWSRGGYPGALIIMDILAGLYHLENAVLASPLTAVYLANTSLLVISNC